MIGRERAAHLAAAKSSIRSRICGSRSRIGNAFGQPGVIKLWSAATRAPITRV